MSRPLRIVDLYQELRRRLLQQPSHHLLSNLPNHSTYDLQSL